MDDTLNHWVLLYLCVFRYIYVCMCVSLYPYRWLLSPSVLSNVTEEITAPECCTTKECGNTYKYVNIQQEKISLKPCHLCLKFKNKS